LNPEVTVTQPNPLTSSQLESLCRGVASRAAAADREGRVPEADLEALRGSGYLLLSLPSRLGGLGADLSACTQAQLELAAASTSTALVAAMPLQLFGHAAEAGSWSERSLEKLAALAREGALINAAASEPDLGSPSRGGLPDTYLERTGSGFRLSGQKSWTTGGPRLTHLIVRARLEDQVVNALVPNHLPGITWDQEWPGSLALRASESRSVRFEAVELPRDALVEPGPGGGERNRWFPALIAATYLGTGLGAYRAALDYARSRVPTALGRPIATLPAIQRQIGEMGIRLEAAKTLLGRAAAGSYPEVVAAKYLATEAALGITELALSAVGGAAVSPELPFERYFRDARGGRMHPPSGDAALELVGKEALGAV
jgi:alkylation response protein AidB-like acyl-CoA dehydrogenase